MPVISRRLLNESTEVPAERSAQRIRELLVRIGAIQVTTRYTGGWIRGLGWTMTVGGAEAAFTLPARHEGVLAVLLGRDRTGTAERRKALEEKAQRIAWRHLLRWVEAQVAFIETGMVEPAEPFSPFAAIGDATLYQRFAETGRLLAEGKTQ